MGLYSETFYTKEVDDILSEKNTIALMLEVEAALAASQEELDIIPKKAADIIKQKCRIESINIHKLKAEIKLSGNAAIPLLNQLTSLVNESDENASGYLHLGATSQDIIDTSNVLQIKQYNVWLHRKIDELTSLLANTTRKHKNTLMIGRTLLQHARPITFGLKTAGWLESLIRSRERLSEIQKRIFCIQLGGAVGSGNSKIPGTVRKNFADRLGLRAGPFWHTNRDNIAEWACSLGILSGSLGKIARDISMLMQTEIGEVLEGAGEKKGRSSTMPHKRNPVTCSLILANSVRVPHLVASVLSAMGQEHERSAGLWHSEWEVLNQLMRLTGGSLDKTVELIANMEVDSERMLKNLEITNGLIYAENVSLKLAPLIGRKQAHELVSRACKIALKDNKDLKEVLKNLDVNIQNIDELFDPHRSIGFSLEIIENILAKYEDKL